jgi:hypothetical protein
VSIFQARKPGLGFVKEQCNRAVFADIRQQDVVAHLVFGGPDVATLNFKYRLRVEGKLVTIDRLAPEYYVWLKTGSCAVWILKAGWRNGGGVPTSAPNLPSRTMPKVWRYIALARANVAASFSVAADTIG